LIFGLADFFRFTSTFRSFLGSSTTGDGLNKYIKKNFMPTTKKNDTKKKSRVKRKPKIKSGAIDLVDDNNK
jgi:hypothetical protein